MCGPRLRPLFRIGTSPRCVVRRIAFLRVVIGLSPLVRSDSRGGLRSSVSRRRLNSTWDKLAKWVLLAIDSWGCSVASDRRLDRLGVHVSLLLMPLRMIVVPLIVVALIFRLRSTTVLLSLIGIRLVPRIRVGWRCEIIHTITLARIVRGKGTGVCLIAILSDVAVIRPEVGIVHVLNVGAGSVVHVGRAVIIPVMAGRVVMERIIGV